MQGNLWLGGMKNYVMDPVKVLALVDENTSGVEGYSRDDLGITSFGSWVVFDGGGLGLLHVVSDFRFFNFLVAYPWWTATC